PGRPADPSVRGRPRGMGRARRTDRRGRSDARGADALAAGLAGAGGGGVALLAAATAAPQHLPGVLHALEPTLDHYGYLAVVGLVFIEDFGVPVPGETILILSAVYAGTGRLNVFLVALLGFCGAVLGDNLGFAIGHFGGRALV